MLLLLPYCCHVVVVDNVAAFVAILFAFLFLVGVAADATAALWLCLLLLLFGFLVRRLLGELIGWLVDGCCPCR